MEFIDNLREANQLLNDFLMSMGVLAPILSSILIVLEGILAFLPLFVFITVNILTLGPVFGAIVSWFCTCIGSFLTFYLCREKVSVFFNKKTVGKKKVQNFMKLVSNLKFKQLVLIIAVPFAPSFFVNLGAGLANISKKKYLYALLIGKIFVVIFWGYIGANLVECLTNPVLFIRVVILIIVAYIIGKIISKKFNIDERF